MALSTFPISSVLLKLAEQEGVNLSVEGIDDVCYGLVISSDKTFLSFLQEHSLPYNWQILDGDPIRVVRRVVNDALTMDHTIVQSECVPAGGAAVSFKRIDQGNLPREIEIQYTDPDRQYATTTRTGRHLGAPLENPGRSIAIDFLISATQARDMAFDTLYRIWAQQLTVSFEHRDVTIEPGDTVHLSCDQGTYILLVTEAIYTASRTTQVSAIVLVSSTEATIPTIDFGSSTGAIGIDIPPGEGDNWPPPAGTTSPSQYTSPDIGGTTSPHVGSNLQISATFAGSGILVADLTSYRISATFAGAGTMVANMTIVAGVFTSASAVFSGIGNLAQSATMVLRSSAALVGAGSMVATLDNTDSFLVRTTGLDATHVDAYRALIDGLNTDGVWTKLDALWVFATTNETTALQNLRSALYPMAKTLSPTFTADQGYAGNATNYLSEATNVSALVQYQQNSGHIMVWDLTTGGSSTRAIGNANSGSSCHIHPRFSDGKGYFRLNSVDTAGCNGTVATTKGCSIASRTSSTVVKGYKNGSEVATTSSDNAQGRAGVVLGIPEIGVANTDLIAAASIGAGLTATDASNLYSRLFTYLQAVGISSPT